MTRIDQQFPWTYDYCPYYLTNDISEREIPCFEIVGSANFHGCPLARARAAIAKAKGGAS